MSKRRIGDFEVNAIGLGCMSLSHAYGIAPSRKEAAHFLHHALDLGYDFLDTAALYGYGANEDLIGETLKSRRHEFILASKCGMTGVDGVRVIDGRPETLQATIDQSLKRLQTDVIDLYYLHRRDFKVPIEESVGALADMVKAGKIRGIGLSEVSAKTIRKAHEVHPIMAVQNEYSLWTRNTELGVLDTCNALGITMVAFSPVGRGFLAGGINNPADLVANDFRRSMPRLQGENFVKNLSLFNKMKAVASHAGFTPAQACLSWLLSQGQNILPIPGTTNIAHLEENFKAIHMPMPAAVADALEQIFNQHSVFGARYAPETQAEIDTEEFPVT